MPHDDEHTNSEGLGGKANKALTFLAVAPSGDTTVAAPEGFAAAGVPLQAVVPMVSCNLMRSCFQRGVDIACAPAFLVHEASQGTDAVYTVL